MAFASSVDTWSYSTEFDPGNAPFQSPGGGCNCEIASNDSVVNCLLEVLEQHDLVNLSTSCFKEQSKTPRMFDSGTLIVPVTWLGTRGLEDIFGYIGVGLAVLSLLCLLWRSRRHLWHLSETCRREELSPAFQQKLLVIKADQMRVLVQASCYLLIPITAWSPWWDVAGGSFKRATAVALAQNVLALLALLPRAVTPRSIDAVHCLLALLLAFVASPIVDGGDVLSLLVLTDGLMLALTVVRRTTFSRLPQLPAVNLVFLASSCALIAKKTVIFGRLQAYFVVAQVLLVLLMTLAAPLLERKSRRLLCRVMEVEELQELVSACRCLLRSCFDVVVELDAGGRISSCGPELGALLLRDRQCLEGLLFSDLIEDEETREAFTARLVGPARKELGLAESLQISMRDACSNSLHLEVMWLSFCKMGERTRERRYLLGLREFADFKREQAPRPDDDAPSILVPLYADVRKPPSARVSVALRESQSVPEMHSVSSGSCLDAGAVLVVDVSKAGCPVHRVSRAFRVQVGNVRRGRELTRLLYKPRIFETWLLAEMDARLDGHGTQGDCRLVFKMPQGRVSAVARLLLPDSSSEEEKGDFHCSVPLLIYAIRTEEEGRAQKMANRGTKPATAIAGRLHKKQSL